MKTLREAEGLYSRERLRALFDAWLSLYLNLEHTFQILKGRSAVFRIDELPLDNVENNCLDLLISGIGRPGPDIDEMKLVFDKRLDLEVYRKNLILIFYKVGLVGLKLDSTSPVSWSPLGGVSISRAEIKDSTKIFIQKTF